MLAAVLTDFNKLVLEEVAVPEPGLHEVVVRVKACGFCATDYKAIKGTRWNVFGITTHEKFELDGGLAHFLEARMDASFGTTPLAMQKAIRLMERGLVDPEAIITHRFPLAEIHRAVEVTARPDRNKVIINP